MDKRKNSLPKIVILLVFSIIMFFDSFVYSSDDSFDLNLYTTSNSVAPGNTLSISFKLSNINVRDGQGGIAGYTADISYDKDIFEFVDYAKGNDEKWNFSCTSEGKIIAYREDTIALNNSNITESGISGVVRLKVKETASTGITKIKLESITGADIDSDTSNTIPGNTNDLEINIEDKETSLKNIEITSNPNKTSYIEGEKFDKTGMEVLANYEDGTSTDITNYTYTPNGELTTKDNLIKISYTENGVTKEATINISVTAKNNSDKINEINTIKTNTIEITNNTSNNESINTIDNTAIIDNKTDSIDEVKQNSIISKESNNDKSTAQNKLPKTGKLEIAIIIVILALVSVGSIIGYRKYRGV